jgi:hypothetical protein
MPRKEDGEQEIKTLRNTQKIQGIPKREWSCREWRKIKLLGPLKRYGSGRSQDSG